MLRQVLTRYRIVSGKAGTILFGTIWIKKFDPQKIDPNQEG